MTLLSCVQPMGELGLQLALFCVTNTHSSFISTVPLPLRIVWNAFVALKYTAYATTCHNKQCGPLPPCLQKFIALHIFILGVPITSKIWPTAPSHGAAKKDRRSHVITNLAYFERGQQHLLRVWLSNAIFNNLEKHEVDTQKIIVENGLEIAKE